MALLDDIYESKWMRANDLRDEPGTFTVDRVEVGEVGQGAEKKAQLIVTFQEFEKPLGLNKTNAGAISDVYGKDTDDWIGEKVVLFPTQVDYQGSLVDAIRVNKKKTLETYQAKLKAERAALKQPAPAARAATRPVTQKDLAAEGLEPVADEDIPF